MPEISRFYGLRIEMYFLDHGKPHFHVRYGEYVAKIDIQSLQIIRGSLPRRVFHLAVEWAEIHRDELMDNWQRTQAGFLPLILIPLFEGRCYG